MKTVNEELNQAFCYLFYRIDTKDIVYVGYHKNADTKMDYYTSSSANPAFKDAWSKGLIAQHIFYSGTVEECISLEHYMLSLMQAKDNPKMYNQTNGGGAGCDLKLITTEMKIIVKKCLDAKFDERSNYSYKQQIDIAKVIANKVKSNKTEGHYEVHNVSVGELANLERIQIRSQYKHNHLINQLVERMRDPIEARKYINPVNVLVYKKTGEKFILNGNHTLNAAIIAKWDSVPVIYLSSDEFKNDRQIMDHFAILMNHSPIVKEGNSRDDVKRKIESLYEEGVELEASYSSDMMQILFDLYLGEFSKESLKGFVTDAKKRIALEEYNSKYNFYAYSKSETEKIVNEYLTANPTHGCVSQSASTVIHSGIGGIVNSLRQHTKKNSKERKNPQGVIFVHYKDMKEYMKRHTLEQELRECLAIANLGWVKIEYLKCFIDTKRNKLVSEPAKAA